MKIVFSSVLFENLTQYFLDFLKQPWIERDGGVKMEILSGRGDAYNKTGFSLNEVWVWSEDYAERNNKKNIFNKIYETFSALNIVFNAAILGFTHRHTYTCTVYV